MYVGESQGCYGVGALIEIVGVVFKTYKVELIPWEFSHHFNLLELPLVGRESAQTHDAVE